MRSERTKKYGIIAAVLVILSVLLNIAPLAVYIITALCGGALVVEKIALCSTVFIVLIMTVISLWNKVAMKSRLWVVLIGLYLCLENIITPLMIIAVCQILDEIIVSPLIDLYKQKKRISHEIDISR